MNTNDIDMDDVGKFIDKMCEDAGGLEQAIEQWKQSLPDGMLEELEQVEKEYLNRLDEFAERIGVKKNFKGRVLLNASGTAEQGQIYRDYCRKKTALYCKYQPIREQMKNQNPSDH